MTPMFSDTELLDALIQNGWLVSTWYRHSGWEVRDSALMLRGSGDTPRSAIADALARLNQAVSVKGTK